MVPPFVLLVALWQQPETSQNAAQTFQVGEHTYRLACTRSGAPASCAVFTKLDSTEVDHFELLDDAGRAIVSRSAPQGSIFTEVSFSGATSYPGHTQVQGLEVQVRPRTGKSGPPSSYEIYFHAATDGLRRFEPALRCAEGGPSLLANPNAWPPTGITPGCHFDTGFFHFTVILIFDFDRYRLGPAPERQRLAIGNDAGDGTVTAARPATVTLYSDHNPDSQSANVSLRKGTRTRILGLWAPVFFNTVENIGTVTYDHRKLWLQVQVSDQTGWILGRDSFHAVGLH